MVILAEITYVHHSETIYYSFIYTTYYNQPTNYIVTEYQTMFALSALERRLPVKVWHLKKCQRTKYGRLNSYGLFLR